MDLLQGLLLIGAVHLLAAAAPGPDFVLVTQQTLSNGRWAGLLCSAGITLGLAVHLLYLVFGLAALIANSSDAMWVLRIVGGGYLIWLGLKGLTARPARLDASPGQKVSSVRQSIWRGFLCNLLNPKAPIYFVALFTVGLSPATPGAHLMVYGVWIMLLQLLWFSALALLFSHALVQRPFKRLGHWLNRLLGGAMLVLGVKVISSR